DFRLCMEMPRPSIRGLMAPCLGPHPGPHRERLEERRLRARHGRVQRSIVPESRRPRGESLPAPSAPFRAEADYRAAAARTAPPGLPARKRKNCDALEGGFAHWCRMPLSSTWVPVACSGFRCSERFSMFALAALLGLGACAANAPAPSEPSPPTDGDFS